MHSIADQTVFGRWLPDELILVILELFNHTDLKFFRLVGRKQERFVTHRVFGHISVRAAAGDWDLFHLAKLTYESHAFCTKPGWIDFKANWIRPGVNRKKWMR